MSHNPTCTTSIHAAQIADPMFSILHLVGYQRLPASDTEPADVIELRRCAVCGSTLGRELGIGARLARAILAGDIPMIGRCNRALKPDPFTGSIDDSAIRSFVDAVEFEALMAGRVTVAGGPDYRGGGR